MYPKPRDGASRVLFGFISGIGLESYPPMKSGAHKPQVTSLAARWPTVLGSFVNDVQVGESSENRRLAYVAMTRARRVLVVALPGNHFDKNSAIWEEWGFEYARSRNGIWCVVL